MDHPESTEHYGETIMPYNAVVPEISEVLHKSVERLLEEKELELLVSHATVSELPLIHLIKSGR